MRLEFAAEFCGGASNALNLQGANSNSDLVVDVTLREFFWHASLAKPAAICGGRDGADRAVLCLYRLSLRALFVYLAVTFAAPGACALTSGRPSGQLRNNTHHVIGRLPVPEN